MVAWGIESQSMGWDFNELTSTIQVLMYDNLNCEQVHCTKLRFFVKNRQKNCVPSRDIRHQVLGWGIRANLIFNNLKVINVHSTHTLLIHIMVHRASLMIKNSPVASDSFHIN